MPLDDAHSSLRPLLARHAAGEPEAGNAVLAHCHGRLKLLTRQMLRKFPDVRRWEETSDVFHNVVVRLTASLAALTFDTPTDFLRLAACQIRRELIDLSRQRRPALVAAPPGTDSNLDAAEWADSTTDDPYNLAAWEEFHSRIAAMPEDDRRLFDLLYYQGLSQQDAAELLDVSIRTLKRSWQHARLRLMRALGNEPPF